MQAALAAIDTHAASLLILGWVGRALLFGTALAALTWLLTGLLWGRVRPTFEAALWLIVLLKFLAPVGPAWSFSLASMCESLPRRAPTQTGLPGILAVPGAAHAAPAFTTASATRTAAPASASRGPRHRPWTTLVAAAYVAGTLGVLIVRTRRQRALLARCRDLPRADESVHKLVRAVCRRLGVRWVPSARISDESSAPFVLGLIRPLLVLSRRQFVRPDELETVIVHEVAHLRRGDLLVRHLQWIAGALLFFWPVVAWVNRRIDVVREYACDEWALRHGKLEPGDYARCLLRAVQPGGSAWLACHPAGMAANHTTIERRIDMILESPHRPLRRPAWGLLTFAVLMAWGVFALAGAADVADADQSAQSSQQAWPATEEAVIERAVELYNLVAQREAADLNGDGQLSYREKSTYLVALAALEQQAFIEQFPYADRDHNDVLDYWEAYDAVRGITLIAYADRRPTAAPGAVLDLEFYHLALDAQQWLLDNVTAEPSAADLANARAIVAMSYSPRAGHVRALDHGAPDGPRKQPPLPRGESGRFGELEGKIAAIEAQLAEETDPSEAAKLQTMLAKLESILAKLQDR